MSEQSLSDDVEILSGRFGHRRGASEEEHVAATYLLDRLKKITPFAYLDEFITTESYFLLFAMYYTEFLIVSIVGIFSASLATVYGIFVFVMYLVEISGGRIFARLLPPLASQNVVAPFHVEHPKRVVIVAVGYDTPVEGILSKVLRSGYAHWIHRGLIVCMLLVLGSTLSASRGLDTLTVIPWISMIQWTAVGALLATAFMFYLHVTYGDDVRGANNNASGVAALLSIAERLKSESLKSTDVWLVAVGNSYGSQDGIRHVLRSIHQDKSETSVLSMQAVGGGTLHYLKGEGLLQPQAYRSTLHALAQAFAGKYGITPATYRGLPTLGFSPNIRGYSAVSVIGLEDGIEPAHAWSSDDRFTEIDAPKISNAADFSFNLIQALDLQD